MLFLRFPHGVQPRFAGRVVLHDPANGVAPARKKRLFDEVHDRFPIREVLTAAKERGTTQQAWIAASPPWDFVEQFQDLFLNSGAVGKRIEQPVREVNLMIVSHTEPPIPGRGPMQIHGHYG